MIKKRMIILLILIILVVLVVATHLFLSSFSVDDSGIKNSTDMFGRSIQLPVSVNKVVATSPPMTIVLYMISPERLKALNSKWSDDELEYVPSQYHNYPEIGGWYGKHDGNFEEFIALNPDIIIDSIKGLDKSIVDQRQEKFGDIPVVAVKDCADVDKMNESIKFIGEIVQANDSAKSLIDFNNKYLSIVNAKSSKISNKKTVYYAEGKDGLQTHPSNSQHTQLIKLVGGENVADSLNQGNLSGEVQVSIEQIIIWNPDIIITTDPEFYASVYNNSNWASIDAIKNHEVYLSPQFPFNWFDKPVGANMIIGLPWTAKVIYPYEYSEINLLGATKEFYSKFYHIDLPDDDVRDILLNSGLEEGNF